jgi:catechol 2,3-dioxygenase-like lactoylglutathione lyase family enzyme
VIDHISISVSDLKKAEPFYAATLAPLGLAKLREWPDAAIGFGKKYPEFWINRRDALARIADDSGVHICLRATGTAAVDAFHAAALAAGGTSDGAPGLRPHYYAGYYAAFIRDLDGNRVEAVTFLREAAVDK